MATDSRIDRLEVAVDGLKDEIQNLRTDINARFAEVNTRINTLTMLMFISVGATILTAVSIIATVLATR